MTPSQYTSGLQQPITITLHHASAWGLGIGTFFVAALIFAGFLRWLFDRS